MACNLLQLAGYSTKLTKAQHCIHKLDLHSSVKRIKMHQRLVLCYFKSSLIYITFSSNRLPKYRHCICKKSSKG